MAKTHHPGLAPGEFDIVWLLAKLIGQKPTSIYKLTPVDAGVISFVRTKVDLTAMSVTPPMMLYRFYLWYCERMQYPAAGFMAFYRLLVRHLAMPRLVDNGVFVFRCKVLLDRLDIGLGDEPELEAANRMIEEAQKAYPLDEPQQDGA